MTISSGDKAFGAVVLLILGLAGCSSSTGGPGSCGLVTKGCVDLLNFSSVAANVFRQGQSAGTGNLVAAGVNNGTALAPGEGSDNVSPTTVGTAFTYDSSVNGVAAASVTCTVTANSWISVNPAVVRQQTGQLTCSDF